MLSTACSARSPSGGSAPLDAAVADAAAPDVDIPAELDVGVPSDTGPTYPPGPYGSSVGSRVQPFALTACNRSGDDATWRFDQADFFTNDVTVVLVVAGWSLPDQMLSQQLETELVQRYQGRRVRLVQVIAQDSNRQPADAGFCNTWVARYALTIPVLIDPTNTLGVYNRTGSFPMTLVVDRNARLGALEYGADPGLASLRARIDDLLTNAAD